MEIRLATSQDIAGLMALEARYFVGALSDAERSHGYVSVLHSRDWFESAVASGGVHVAVAEDEAIVGSIAVTDPPAKSAAGVSPIVHAMLELAETVTFAGRPIAQQRYAIRGPVVIERAVRGQGIYSAFNAVARQAYAPRFELGVLFVASDNPRSLHTTTTKLGATDLAEFEVDAKRYHFLGFAF